MYLSADRMYSSRQGPFLITETNASHIGFSWDSRPAYDGQWRQAAWAHVARGARMIGYWHWDTLHFGTETYWGGILPHNGVPGRTYRELAQLGAEFRQAGDLVAELTPDADIAVVVSVPSRWIMQKYPALSHPDGTPDERAYQGLVEPFYRGAFDAGLQVRILHASQLTATAEEAVRQYPVLVAAGLYLTDDATLDWLRAYADAGGHLVIGPRTGYADTEARARTDRMPARLADAAGVWYDEFSNLPAPIEVTAAPGALDLPPDAAATRWIDGLQPDGATVLATYQHPHFGRWPAVTTRDHGRGRITHVGTVPNIPLAEALLRWAAAGRQTGWPALPVSVTCTGATASDGRRLRFLHNWSWRPTVVTAPVECRDALTGKQLPAGRDIELAAWDVRILARGRDDSGVVGAGCSSAGLRTAHRRPGGGPFAVPGCGLAGRSGAVVKSDLVAVGKALPARLTPRGRRSLEQASAAVRSVEVRMLAGLTEDEQSGAFRILPGMIHSLRDGNDGA